MRALTPRRLAHAGKASLLLLLCRPSIPPPTTSWTRASPSYPRQCVRPVLTPGFVLGPQTRRTTTPKRVRYPAGCSFASGCSPPRLPQKPRSWSTQLPSATCGVFSHGLDFHLLTEQHRRRTVPGLAPLALARDDGRKDRRQIHSLALTRRSSRRL